MANQRPETIAVHAGEQTPSADDPHGAGLVLSNTFAFDDADQARSVTTGETEGYIYTRWRNPTVEAFEQKAAALEGAESAVAVGSGMAAIYGVMMTHLAAGGRVVAPESVYAETAKVLRNRMARFGVTTEFVDMTNLTAVARAVTKGTSVVWTETPANPTLAITDLTKVTELAHAAGAVVITDNTFATSYHQQPLKFGVDAVVHSATKAIGGHGDAIGGLVLGSEARMTKVREEVTRGAGAVLAPLNAWLLARGLSTMPLRVARASATAAELARRLSADKRVAKVFYPGLATHPGHDIAARQMVRGFGSLFAFEVAGGVEAGRAAYNRVNLVTRAVSLGELRTLITHAATTTHASMPPEQRKAAGISDGLVRISAGIEDVEDLWSDLDQALG